MKTKSKMTLTKHVTDDQITKNNETFFKNAMRKAFHHGQNYKPNDNVASDLILDDAADQNLPFSEWFVKHYPNPDYTDHLNVGDLIKILQQHDPNMPLVITHAGKDHQYMLIPDYVKIIRNAYFGNDDVGQKFEETLTDNVQDRQEYLNIATI